MSFMPIPLPLRFGEPTTNPPAVTCPCCRQARPAVEDTPLLAIEEQIRQQGSDPWRRPHRWSIRDADASELYWACSSCIETGAALVGQPWLQRYCDYQPYFAYWDHTMHCEDCGQDFIFAGAEQRYWYEQLRFWVQSYPKQCRDCRGKRRATRPLARALNEALAHITTADALQLVHIADLHAQLGHLARARTFLQQARKRTANLEQRAMIESALQALSTGRTRVEVSVGNKRGVAAP